MALTLHVISGAPRGWRVQMGLAFKGLAAEIRYLSSSDGDHRKADFLALNPRGTVPVLETDGGILRDSIAILAWLDRRYPENPLFGRTADEAGRVWQITMECCDYLREAGDRLLRPVFAGHGSVPAEDSPERVRLHLAADQMHDECHYLEDLLGDGRPYLAGARPSTADAVAFPEIRLVQRAVETKPDLMAALGFGYPPELYPNVADWKARLNGDPRVAATMPVHWTEAPLPVLQTA